VSQPTNLLGGPPPTLLPDDADVRAELAAGVAPRYITAPPPSGPLA
jgi:hypothetical protein